MSDTILSDLDDQAALSLPSQAVESEGDAFTVFDAKLHGARFAEQIGAYWCEVAIDREDVEYPKYSKRRKINVREEWERLHEYEYIRFNTPNFADMIVLDVDDKDSGALAKGTVKNRMRQLKDIANAMPVKPMMIGMNPAPGKRSFQMIWRLERPAYRSGPERHLYNLLQSAITRLFGGDPNFNGSLSRNPLSLTDQNDGYFWWFSSWEPSTWYEMNLHYAREAFEDFEQFHEDILEQEVRIATAEKLFEPDRDGRKAKKKEVKLTFDVDGNVNRRSYVFRKSAADAGSLMFTGQLVTPETVYPLVVAASEDAYAVDPRLERLDDRFLRRTAKYVAEWVNDKMIPGGGRELRYPSNSKYTRSQASMGGQVTSAKHMSSGHWANRVRPEGPKARSVKSAERYAEKYEQLRQAAATVEGKINVSQLAADFSLTRPTVYKVLREAGIIEPSTTSPGRKTSTDAARSDDDSGAHDHERQSRRRGDHSRIECIARTFERPVCAMHVWSA